jgi:hypothetical protein
VAHLTSHEVLKGAKNSAQPRSSAPAAYPTLPLRPCLELSLGIFLRNDLRALSLTYSSSALRQFPMVVLPVDRALRIYGALADRSEAKGARKRLSEHLMKNYIAGEKETNTG